MSIGTAEAKTTDAGNAGLLSPRPRSTFAHNTEWFFRPGEARSRVLAMQVNWKPFMLKGQEKLDDPGNSRGSFQMSYVCFDRANI